MGQSTSHLEHVGDQDGVSVSSQKQVCARNHKIDLLISVALWAAPKEEASPSWSPGSAPVIRGLPLGDDPGEPP